MTSDFESFKKELFGKLKKGSKKCLNIIEKNNKVVEYYLTSNDLFYTKNFLNDFNDIVVNTRDVKFYKLFEEILNHKLFNTVLAEFRESEVLIKACKIGNEKVVKWLLTMNINFGVQTDLGMTALMYAVKQPNLDFAIKKIMETNGKHIYFVNKKGNNALFLSTRDIKTFREFLKYKDKYQFDLSSKNPDNENIFLFCCRYNKINHIDYYNYLCKNVPFDPNQVNIEDKTAAMYLVESCKNKLLKTFVKDYNIDPNFKTVTGNTLVSCFIKNYYKTYMEVISQEQGFGVNLSFFETSFYTLMALVELGCNLDEPIDKNGTTMSTIFLKLRDDHSYSFIVSHGAKELDLLIEDKTNLKENYPGVDISNPVVLNNIKTSQKWIKLILIDNHFPVLNKLLDIYSLNPMYR
jgi:ankyrin repeat protein